MRSVSASSFRSGRCRTEVLFSLSFLCLALLVLRLVMSSPIDRQEGVGQERSADRSQTRAKAVAKRSPNLVAFLAGELSRCRPSLDERQRWRIAGAIHDHSRSYGYDPLFVLAMIEIESACSPGARGPRGALGLIQVQPRTARVTAPDAGLVWSGPAMLIRSNLNLRLGLQYLANLEKRFNDPWVAIAAYNMGPTRASKLRPETARRARYVRKILAAYEDLLRCARQTR